MQRKNHSNVSIDTMSKLELPENKNQHIPDILKKTYGISSYEAEKKLIHSRIKDTPNLLAIEDQKALDIHLKTKLMEAQIPEDEHLLIINTLKQVLYFILSNKEKISEIMQYTGDYIEEAFSRLRDPEKVLKNVAFEGEILDKILGEDLKRQLEQNSKQKEPKIKLKIGNEPYITINNNYRNADKKTDECLTSKETKNINYTEKNKNYTLRLRSVLGSDIVNINTTYKITSLPIFWLKQLDDTAIQELSSGLEVKKSELRF